MHEGNRQNREKEPVYKQRTILQIKACNGNKQVTIEKAKKNMFLKSRRRE